MRKKILLLLGLSFLLIFGITMTSFLILNIPNESDDCICENWEPVNDFPYQFKPSPSFNESNICVFPDMYLYSNCKIHWNFTTEVNLGMIIGKW